MVTGIPRDALSRCIEPEVNRRLLPSMRKHVDTLTPRCMPPKMNKNETACQAKCQPDCGMTAWLSCYLSCHHQATCTANLAWYHAGYARYHAKRLKAWVLKTKSCSIWKGCFSTSLSTFHINCSQVCTELLALIRTQKIHYHLHPLIPLQRC